MISRNWGRMMFALIVLACFAVFALPKVAEAKSPPGAAQVSQDYTVHQETIAAHADVDIGARQPAALDESAPALVASVKGYMSAFGRAATNERYAPADRTLDNYKLKAPDRAVSFELRC